MKIQDKNIYHGAVLHQIAEHPSFTALNRAGAEYGHYAVNTSIRLIARHSAGDGPAWNFNLDRDELDLILQDEANGHDVYLSLACGSVTICCLSVPLMRKIINFDSEKTQSVRVTFPEGGGMRVSCGGRRLKEVIPHNSFPEMLFNQDAA